LIIFLYRHKKKRELQTLLLLGSSGMLVIQKRCNPRI